jgi:hypothetical protein
MTTYKSIIGKAVKNLSSNPDNIQAEGQVWYNSTDNAFKNVITSSTFSSAASLISARSDFRGTFGTQSAFKGAGGFTTTPTGNTPALTDVEDYDGTGFTSAAVLPLATRNQGGGGTTSAGWVAGGRRYPTSPANQTNKTQEWDGSSWSEGGNLGSSKYGNSGTGTLTAGLVSGGFDNAAPGNLNETEEYNGSTWSEQNNMGTARYRTAATGTQTATILFGGVTYPGSPQDVDNVEEYDGTSWTTLTSLPSDRGMGHAFGTTTNAIVTGGRTGPPGASNTTLQWDGTSYTSFPTLSTARFNGGDGAITSPTAGIVAGGYSTTSLTTVEEYNQSGIVTTGAAFASGGNLVDGRGFLQSATQATQNAGLIFGGWQPGTAAASLVEEYDGSSWSEVNNMPETKYYAAGAGTQTAALGAGGYGGSPETVNNKTFEYDGTNWTSGGNLTVNRAFLGGTGTLTAAVVFGGGSGGAGGPTATEEYNGSSWTAGNVLPQSNTSMIAVGIQTAALSAGGDPATAKNSSAEYDGTNWTAGNNMNIIRANQGAGFGVQTSAIVACGNTPPGNNAISSSEQYNGTSFVTGVSASTARKYLGSSGATQANGLISGGDIDTSNNTNATEEYTPESTALNVKTITVS